MKNKSIKVLIILTIVILFSTGVGYPKEKTVTLNFDNVDISVFLKTMSELTGKSFVLSDKVRGTLSFISSRPIPVNMVYDVVLSILKARGFYAVPGVNNIVKIFPTQEAIKMPTSIYYGTEELDLPPDLIVTHILPVTYSTASEIMNVVRPVFGQELIINVFQRNNALISTGIVRSINLLIEMVKYLDTEIPAQKSDIHIYNLENSSAENIAQVLNNLARSFPQQRPTKQQQPQRPTTGARFQVVANKETNSIIVISDPQDWDKILNIVKELDRKRDQVLVEALIVEITLNDNDSLGFDLNALIDLIPGASGLIASNTGLMQESIQTGGLYGLTIGLLNGTIPSAYAILNANKENTNFKILSTPEIVTLDNEEAVITIGEQIPFLTSSRVDENNNVISTYEYKDIGIVLKITPQINKNGYITLTINQQVKKLVEGTTVLENPSVYNREISSKVTVRDSRTIVIGGLIRDDTVKIVQKVPILGDIPILGLLFRKRTNQRIRTNLLIFLTPHIVTEEEKMQKITEQKRKEQQEFGESTKKKK
ncbi:MAG: hypothetical protein DRP54_07485 [Spirochaetes bacterium]|nr:MAG: hypothetical protein DRP54_07485 [Spirochaetota bacterium]